MMKKVLVAPGMASALSRSPTSDPKEMPDFPFQLPILSQEYGLFVGVLCS